MTCWLVVIIFCSVGYHIELYIAPRTHRLDMTHKIKLHVEMSNAIVVIVLSSALCLVRRHKHLPNQILK